MLNVPAAWFTSVVGRKRLAIAAFGASRFVYLPLVAFPFLSLPDATRLRLFIALTAIGAVLAVIGNNAWITWMGDLVPSSVRGRFFGRRTMCLTLAGGAASLGVGLSLDALSVHGWKEEALASLAALSCLAGLTSICLLRRQHEPAAAGKTRTEHTGWAALTDCLKDRSLRPFLWYQLAWNAAVACVATFFSFHMLVNLRMGFALVAAHGVAIALVRILAAPLWGRAVDRLGARPVIVLCSFGIATVPAIWMLATPERLWPVAVDALVTGVLWGGHVIAMVDLSVGLAPRRGRPFYLAAFATAGGLGFATASLLAGLLASTMPTRFPMFGLDWTPIHVLLLISALARASAAGLALRIQEPNARGVPELLRSLAGDLPRALGLRRMMPVPKPWAANRRSTGRRRRERLSRGLRPHTTPSLALES